MCSFPDLFLTTADSCVQATSFTSWSLLLRHLRTRVMVAELSMSSRDVTPRPPCDWDAYRKAVMLLFGSFSPFFSMLRSQTVRERCVRMHERCVRRLFANAALGDCSRTLRSRRLFANAAFADCSRTQTVRERCVRMQTVRERCVCRLLANADCSRERCVCRLFAFTELHRVRER